MFTCNTSFYDDAYGARNASCDKVRKLGSVTESWFDQVRNDAHDDGAHDDGGRDDVHDDDVHDDGAHGDDVHNAALDSLGNS
ncbi:hypothetical protein K0H71_16785 [Bacillus sp. IITD106]|nr:hypothetical protein [Bacillus sp. IITD106]